MRWRICTASGSGAQDGQCDPGKYFPRTSVVVDTHVKRISKRLGFTKEEDPEKIEMELMKVLPKDTGFSTIYRSSPSDGRYALPGIQSVRNAF